MDEKEYERRKIVAENIKKLIKEKGITQKQLAKEIGMSQNIITEYVKLRSFPSGGVLQKIADYFEVKKSDIDTTWKKDVNSGITPTIEKTIDTMQQLEESRQQTVLDTANNQLIEQNNELENAEARERKILSLDSKPIDITKIPGYMPYEADKLGTAPILGDIAAGYNIMAEENFDGMIPVGPEYAGRDDIFWLNIRGQSMESLIHDGTLGLFEHSEDIHDGRIGAVMSENGDWITVKRIYHNYDENGYLLGLTLVPENEECDTIVINEYNPGRIIGRLLEVKQYF
ncbi:MULTISPECIES: XRE family transcriptional regulator [Lactococcus]|uniref:XRE family transcriptional regulator n=1 Tax=Lactococcus TaxID=1357 RepID=UPI001D1929FE|nr:MULTISPECIES: XRE family transcriptional regulator [Lactococcus]MCC4119893.1 XRE family transcriptional regulator [Lactococcus lactis]MCT0501498.1 XRE family transcriptional regulator [Lactococcus cremoris]